MRAESVHLPAAPSGRERFRDSYWVAWTFTLAFNWIAFFWIAYRGRNRRWALWGCVYAVPFAVLMALPETGTATEATTWLAFALGIASIVHAFKVRPAYVARRRAQLGLPDPEPWASPSPTGEGSRRATARSAGRTVAIVTLYLVVGLIVGGVVLLAALFSDPCLPFCVSDEYERTELVDTIAIVGGLAYLALLVPMLWSWGTGRVWWVVLLGGPAIGVLGLLLIWLSVRYTGAPASCNC